MGYKLPSYHSNSTTSEPQKRPVQPAPNSPLSQPAKSNTMGWKTLSTVDIHGNDEQITQKKEAVNMLFANLNNLHVHLFNREKIAEFLERYPLVQGILLQVASHLSGAFPENSQLTLSWHNVDSLYEALCLNLRLKDYPPSVVDELMDLQKMIDEYDLINDNPGLFTVSSDFVII